ncbi:MAG: hypothetical protein K9J21_02135 [Bacteroidales bacterium]|nr:hypothetical protein [Bacteroidales bacterium]
MWKNKVENLKNVKKTKFVMPLALILLAAFTRLIPHPGNFTPIIAIALFGASKFRGSKLLTFSIPLIAMLITDIFLNKIMMGAWSLTYPGVAYNYMALFGVIALGMMIFKNNKKFLRKTSTSIVGGNLLFFLISNFGVFMTFSLYPASPQGLLAAYVAGLPFLLNQLAATIVWSGVLFGSDALINKYASREEAAIA